MNNKKMLDTILKIRDIRNNLSNFNIKEEEKEILRKTLNYYEDMLNLDITRNNNNNFDVVEIPLEENTTRYKEFVFVPDNKTLEILNGIESSISNINLNEDEIKVLLSSLKEYCLYLEQVNMMRKNNLETLNEIRENKTM